MQVTWTNVGNEIIEILATTVHEFRLNVTASNNNFSPWKFYVAEVNGMELLAEGHAKTLESAMSKATVKAFEIRNERLASAELEAMNWEPSTPVDGPCANGDECYAAGSGVSHSHVDDRLEIVN